MLHSVALHPPVDDKCENTRRRIRQFFLAIMAAYLTLTASLKFVAACFDTPALRAPDPLIKTLTERQMGVAAACLEALIVVAVVRWRQSNIAPWLLLCLAIAFGLYRAGLWRSGSAGSCPCLGHLFDWSAFLSRAADLVLLSSIAIMALGSLFLILYHPRPS